MRIKFWGVRGSHPVAGKCFNRFGGHTSCVEIQAGTHRLILDAGTGIIGLGQELFKEYSASKTDERLKIHLFFSHMHHDHNQGFPFFVPAYLSEGLVYVFGPKLLKHGLEEVLAQNMVPPLFPVEMSDLGSVRITQHVSDVQEIVVSDTEKPTVFHRFDDANRLEAIRKDEKNIVISTFRSLAHPRDGVIIYRIQYRGKSVVYATDTEGYVGGDQRLARFAEGCDLLIHDAQYSEEKYLAFPTQGYGHSTPAMALAVAKVCKAGKLVLFHHDPSSTDDVLEQVEKEAIEELPGTVVAREGMVLEL